MVILVDICFLHMKMPLPYAGCEKSLAYYEFKGSKRWPFGALLDSPPQKAAAGGGAGLQPQNPALPAGT